MEKTAINTVYVVTEDLMYKNGSHWNVIIKAFFREDEANNYATEMEVACLSDKPDYILWDKWEVKETKII